MLHIVRLYDLCARPLHNICTTRDNAYYCHNLYIIYDINIYYILYCVCVCLYAVHDLYTSVPVGPPIVDRVLLLLL